MVGYREKLSYAAHTPQHHRMPCRTRALKQRADQRRGLFLHDDAATTGRCTLRFTSAHGRASGDDGAAAISTCSSAYCEVVRNDRCSLYGACITLASC